jgi:NitT/TauT family transport system substrate-binding protein
MLFQQNASMTGAFIPAQQPIGITIAQAVGPASGLLYIAGEKGFLADEGLDATIIPFTSGRLALDALLSGKAQAALAAETPLALAAFQNRNFVIVATIAESPHKLVMRNGAAIKSPQDLRGKRVSALKGSAGEFWMHSYLKANGLRASDVTFVNLQPPDMVAALARGDIDAFFSWEPYPYQAQKQMGGNVTIISSRGIYLQTFNVAVERDFAEKNPEALKRLLRALLKAEQFVKDNRQESVRIVAKNSKMDESMLAGIWDDHRFAVALEPHLLDYMRGIAAWAKATGIATADTPDYRAFILDVPLREIRPGAVSVA